ncbi:right-handed parallel beta-helix repeat-containing protein [Klebsiella oxytoca]
MSNLPEQPAWESGIHQLEESDRAKAGPGGVLNTQATQLANRTQWLRALVESAQDYREYTFYKSESDPDGTIAGLSNTPTGKMFRVAQGMSGDNSFIYYLNDSGTAKAITALPGTDAFMVIKAYFDIFSLLFSQSGSGNLFDWYDKEGGKLVAFMDSAGQLFLPGFDNRPVQALLSDVESMNERVNHDHAPAVLRLTNEQNALLGFVDDMGEHHIPGLGGESLQKYIRTTRENVNNLYKYRQSFDAILDFGINNSGLVDVAAQIQTAINYVSKLPYGGAIYFPDGVYRLHTEVVPRNNVTITMAPGRARFLPVGRHGAITKRGIGAGYLSNARFIDVTVDGAEQSLYGFMVKGFYLQYFEDTLLLRCNVHDIGASGIGVDFPSNSFILDCTTKNCGRLASLGNAGSSGIGIGTGARQDESLIISRSINTGNKNFGIFFEQQTDSDTIYLSRQIIVSDSIMTGNGWGFGDCGISGVILNGCQINDNLHEGVLIDSGTLTVNANRPQSGNYGIVSNCQIQRNGSHGVNYSSMKSLGGGGYTFSTNKIMTNQGSGVNIEAKPEYSLPDMMVTQNDIIGNSGDALQVKSGTWTDIDITGNRILRNGGNINIIGNIDKGSITGNKLRSINGAHAIEGSGAVTDIDIAENQYTDTNETPVNLTGTQTNVTFGRNPGF